MSKVLYTGGTFDLFHYGHVNFLKQCKMLADEVVVSLNTDEFIETFKSKKPVQDYRERELSLLGCKYVDRVIPNIGGLDSKPSILQAKSSIVAIGDDWAKKDYYSQMSFTQEWLDKQGVVLVYIPYTRGISSTELKNRVVNQSNTKK